MSQYQQEKENTMEKQLLIAICFLFLSACGSVLGTSTPASNVVDHTMAPVATASTQSVCQVLHDRQTQLNQEYHAASAQLTTSQTGRNLQQVGEVEKTLIRQHQSIAQVQTQLKAC
jgi:uncharacterized lipoprotein YajG